VIPPEAAVHATVDLTLAECCERWGISRNAVKARAAALGVELRRESSTRTVWPGEDVPLGDRLHRHLKQGGTLASFPEALPPPGATTDRSVASPTGSTDRRGALSVASPGGISDDMQRMAALIVAAREALPPPPDPLAVPRALAAAADEGLPLTSEELASLIGWSVGDVEQRDGKPRASFTLRGFRLQHRGRGEGKAWYVSRVVGQQQPEASAKGGVGSLASPGATTDGSRMGFRMGEVIEARVEVLPGPSLFPLPR